MIFFEMSLVVWVLYIVRCNFKCFSWKRGGGRNSVFHYFNALLILLVFNSLIFELGRQNIPRVVAIISPIFIFQMCFAGSCYLWYAVSSLSYGYYLVPFELQIIVIGYLAHKYILCGNLFNVIVCYLKSPFFKQCGRLCRAHGSRGCFFCPSGLYVPITDVSKILFFFNVVNWPIFSRIC